MDNMHSETVTPCCDAPALGTAGAKSNSWVSEAGSVTKDDLAALLDHAWKGYVQHTDWHLLHVDRAVHRISGIIAAEVTLLGLFTQSGMSQRDFNSVILSVVSLMLAVMSGLVMRIGRSTSRVSFRRSMEHLIMANKVLWAMGYGGSFKPETGQAVADPDLIPAVNDPSIYTNGLIRSWTTGKPSEFQSYKEMIGKECVDCTSEAFATYHTDLKAHGVSRDTRRLILMMGVAGCFFGLVGCAVGLWHWLG